MSEPQPETLPPWVVQEVGRLHLHALALERALAQQEAEQHGPDDEREQS